MEARVDERLLRTATRVIVDRFAPDKVILFGSRARGDARTDSDYDLLIIGESGDSRWRRSVPVYLALADLAIPAEVFWWTSEEIEEWSSVRSHYVYRALREGLILYEKVAARPLMQTKSCAN
jgi:predicted nucleotidyltransferase